CRPRGEVTILDRRGDQPKRCEAAPFAAGAGAGPGCGGEGGGNGVAHREPDSSVPGLPRLIQPQPAVSTTFFWHLARCPGSDGCETGWPLKGIGDLGSLALRATKFQEIPDEGFWPSASSVSRRAGCVSPDGGDPRYRSRQARRLA